MKELHQRDISSNLPNNWINIPLEFGVDILDSQRVPINSTERSERRITRKNQTRKHLFYEKGVAIRVNKLFGNSFDNFLKGLNEVLVT